MLPTEKEATILEPVRFGLTKRGKIRLSFSVRIDGDDRPSDPRVYLGYDAYLQLISLTGVEDIHELVGRRCIVELSGEKTKFCRLYEGA